jgi:hypothetical protein
MSSWDQANRGEKLDFVWRNRKKKIRKKPFIGTCGPCDVP